MARKRRSDTRAIGKSEEGGSNGLKMTGTICPAEVGAVGIKGAKVAMSKDGDGVEGGGLG